jgi:hypothetical protein
MTNGIPPDGEVNGQARQIVTASSFRAIQEKLRSLSRKPPIAAAREAAPGSIPDLQIETEAPWPAELEPPMPVDAPDADAHREAAPQEPAPIAESGIQPPDEAVVEAPAEAEASLSPKAEGEPEPQIEAAEQPLPPAELAADVPLAELPAEASPGEVPAEVPAAELQTGAPSAELQAEASPAEFPAEVPAPEFQTEAPSAELAADASSAGLSAESPEPLSADIAAAEPSPVEAVVKESLDDPALAAARESQEPAPASEEPLIELPHLSDEAKPAGKDDVLRPLVEKFSGTAALLKKIETESDPFSETSSGIASEEAESDAPLAGGLIDPQSGEVARSLLDVMSAPSGTSQPQERALAADTLLRLVPRLPLKNLIGLVERVSLMEMPPQLLVRRLIRDPRSEIAGPLLERASAISDQDLMAVIASGDASKQRLIARRRTISPALADAVINAGDAGAILTLVRNPGATFSIESFHRLGELAAGMPALQAPLATRLDTPAPVAFELFWALPAELRRYILSRFLTDSEILDRVLKIALSVELTEDQTPEPKFPDRAKIDEFVELVAGGDRQMAAGRLAELAGISEANANRIIADREGEPITVVLKTLGVSRARFAEIIDILRQEPQPVLPSDRNISDLQSIFDSLSFNKARMLLTYWDWASQHSGPYSRSHK